MALEDLLLMTVPGENHKGEPVQVRPDFRVAVQKQTDAGVHFIIHPSGYDGETLDFVARGNTLTPLAEQVLFHAKRDPLICPGRDEHEFAGWRDFEDGRGGESVCKHCGTGAMEHTLALDI